MKRFSFLTGLLCLSLLLGACTATDADLAQSFLDDWMKAKGIMYQNKEGEWVYDKVKMVGVIGGWETTGDKVLDAIISEMGLTAQSLKDAKEQSDEADKAIKGNPPDYKKAMGHLEAAENLRPDDYHYKNEKAKVYLLMDNPEAAQREFDAAKAACNGNSRCEDAARRDKLAQMLSATEQIKKDQERGGKSADCDTYKTLKMGYDTMRRTSFDVNDKWRYKLLGEDVGYLLQAGNCN